MLVKNNMSRFYNSLEESFKDRFRHKLFIQIIYKKTIVVNVHDHDEVKWIKERAKFNSCHVHIFDTFYLAIKADSFSTDDILSIEKESYRISRPYKNINWVDSIIIFAIIIYLILWLLHGLGFSIPYL